MGKITDIARQKGNKNRVSIFIDGAFFCGLEALTAVKNNLAIGDEIDENELAELQAESEYVTALDKALNRLSVRERSIKEIRTFLREKGYLGATADKVVERLKELGYLDERGFAEKYAASVKARYGAARIRAELKQKGVSRDIIDEVLDELDLTEETLALARSLLRATCDKRKLKEKLYRKGCSTDTINEAIALLEDEGAFDGEDDE